MCWSNNKLKHLAITTIFSCSDTIESGKEYYRIALEPPIARDIGECSEMDGVHFDLTGKSYLIILSNNLTNDNNLGRKITKSTTEEVSTHYFMMSSS